MSKNLSPSKLRKREEWLARQKQMKAAVRDNIDVYGPMLAEFVAVHWSEHDAGPLWREALSTPELTRWWKDVTGLDYIGRSQYVLIMEKARGAGWVAYRKQERSLCSGRRFYSRQHAEVSQAGPNEIGYCTAAFVGAFRDAYDYSPDWVQVSIAADAEGAPLFASPEDAAAQFRWLNTSGWLFQQGDGSLRRGQRAKFEEQRRAVAEAAPEPAMAG